MLIEINLSDGDRETDSEMWQRSHSYLYGTWFHSISVGYYYKWTIERLKQNWGECGGQQAPGAHIAASSCSRCFTSHPATCLRPGKTVEEAQEFGTLHPCGKPGRSSQRRVLFWPSYGCHSYLRNEIVDWRSFPLCLSPL